MESEEKDVSVLDPITPAVGRVKLMLFGPFSFKKWLLVAFLAWLVQLSLGNAWLLSQVFSVDLPQMSYEDILDFNQDYERWLTENLPILDERIADALEQFLPLMIGLAIGGAILSLVCIWIRSRSHFLFLNSIAQNESRLAEPWRAYGPQGNSLFLFRLSLVVLSTLTWLPLVGVIFYQFYQMIMAAMVDWDRIWICLLCALVSGFFGLIFGVINKLTNDFVTPIMAIRGLRCRAAWGEFRSLFARRWGTFIIYLLFQILLQGALGIFALLAIPLTCGLVSIPFVGVLILLPLLIFNRAYSLYYLALFGDEYDIFTGGAHPDDDREIDLGEADFVE
jgi:hypothetical protein